MKKLKKTIATVFVFGIFCCTLSVNAEKIIDEEQMRSEVEASILSSAFVRTQRFGSAKKGLSPERRSAIASVCDRRIGLLSSILIKGKLERSEVASAVGNYVGASGIGDSYESRQLHRSVTDKDLKYNVELLIGVYKAIRAKYAPLPLPAADTPADKHRPTHHLHKCPDRKGVYRQGGRFGRK